MEIAVNAGRFVVEVLKNKRVRLIITEDFGGSAVVTMTKDQLRTLGKCLIVLADKE